MYHDHRQAINDDIDAMTDEERRDMLKELAYQLMGDLPSSVNQLRDIFLDRHDTAPPASYYAGTHYEPRAE